MQKIYCKNCDIKLLKKGFFEIDGIEFKDGWLCSECAENRIRKIKK